jgi:uncharacterized protein (DUF58 family)
LTVRRTLLIAVLIYALLLAGLVSLNGAFIAVALPLVVYLAAVIFYQPSDIRLKVTRVLSKDYVRPGTEVTVTVTVTNGGPDLDEIAIEDNVPAGLALDGDASQLASLPANQTRTLSYSVSGSRGTYTFGAVTITAREHFALFRRSRPYNIASKLSVIPDCPQLQSLKIRPVRTRGFAGPIPSRQGGSGTDFFGVRAYEPGDPPQWINWRLSARHQTEVYTNVFEQERIADVGLILDARDRSNVVANGDSLFEHSIEVTAALAEAFLHDGNRVGLLVYGRGLERTFPDFGKQQRQRILRALSRAQVGDSLVFDSLDYLPTRFFPAKSQLVLISPLCAEDPPVLVRLRSREYQVLVVSPDPVQFEARGIAPSPARDLATRLAAGERQLWIRQLQRIGVPVISWDVGQSLDATIQAGLKKDAPRPWRQ